MRRILPVLLVVACGGEPVAPEPDPLMLRTTAAWPGGTIVVAAPWVADSVPVVWLGGQVLEAALHDGDSLVLRVPTNLPVGNYELRVGSVPGVLATGTVHIGGFTGIVQGPIMTGVPLAWPAGSPVGRVLVHGVRGLLDVDLRYGTSREVVSYADANDNYLCQWGPGPSVRTTDVIFCGRNLTLYPTVALDTLRRWVGYRMVARYDSTHAISTYHHEFLAGDGLAWRAEGARTVVASPDGRRMAVLLYSSIFSWVDGVPVDYPVFGPEGVAYALPTNDSRRFFHAAAFTPGSDTLLLAVRNGYEPDTDTLLVLDAVSGSQLAAYPLPCDPFAAGVTPAGFVAVCGTRIQRVVILRLSDGVVVGDVDGLPSGWGDDANLVVSSPAEGAFYVVVGYTLGTSWDPPNVPLTSYRFVFP